MKNRENIDPMYVLFRPATKEFVAKAAEHVKTSASDFARALVIAGAEKALGKKAPEVEEFHKGSAPGLISQAAAKAGLTIEQLKSKLATEALGGKWAPRAGTGTGTKKANGKKAKKA